MTLDPPCLGLPHLDRRQRLQSSNATVSLLEISLYHCTDQLTSQVDDIQDLVPSLVARRSMFCEAGCPDFTTQNTLCSVNSRVFWALKVLSFDLWPLSLSYHRVSGQ